MMIRRSILLLLLLCNITTGYAGPSQSDEAPKWYQIELFIFANMNPDSSGDEQWRQNLNLKYPERIVIIEPPVSTGAETTSDNTARLIQTTDTEQGTMAASVSLTENTTEQPFMLLDDSEHQLTDAINRILRQKDFRKLFHAAWRQPLTDRKQSESVLIRGGDQFDQHFELEGTVKFSVERYLHVSTDLWFSTFISNIGGTESPWPVLPEPPVPSMLSTLPSDDTHSAQQDNFLLAESSQQGFFSNPLQPWFNQLFSVERTVTLRQQRRMRSNELHYLDHPLLGILVKVVPYETADPEATETAALPDS